MKQLITMAVLGLGTAGFATGSAQAGHDREFRTSYYNTGYSAYNSHYAPQVNYGGCYNTPYAQPSYNTRYSTPSPYGNQNYYGNPYQGGYNYPNNYGAYRQPYPYSGNRQNAGYGWHR